MNDTRRKKLKEAYSQLDDAKNTIEGVKDEEEESLESMPDDLKEGEKGEKAQETIDYLANAIEALDGAMEQLNYIE